MYLPDGGIYACQSMQCLFCNSILMQLITCEDFSTFISCKSLKYYITCFHYHVTEEP
jgi:hypothetical protein